MRERPTDPGGHVALVLLEPDPVARGDLFARLMGDLFHTLGYGACRFNIHKTGREVDVLGDHRVEPRGLVAECKATHDPVGGSDLNKFAGVLDAECRLRPDVSQTGYFVSLSGFTESALQQELDVGHRFILLDGAHVLTHLIEGRVLVDRPSAAAAAASVMTKPLPLHPRQEVLALSSGWLWVIFFGPPTHDPTHFAFVHADGTPISSALARDIRASAGTRYENLKLVSARTPPPRRSDQAQTAYRAWIALTCGDITLDGMPADEHVGGRRIRLESLYVPQRLVKRTLADPNQPNQAPVHRATMTPEIVSVGDALRSERAFSVLGGPGVGKSTLVKRLAAAYADSSRRPEVDDALPDEQLVPIVIRCRDLPSSAFQTFNDVLKGLVSQLERPELAVDLLDFLYTSARAGTALLLIDGLDEIPDAGVRQHFVNQLRVFIATYPQVRLLVTSREFGFRVVAGSVDSICTRYAVGALDQNDIRRLTLAWYRETGTASEAAASAVVDEILASDRVHRLAENPLLLTILLLVRRWAGEVPRRRTVLYDKAIDVLLATWNVEGHEPIAADEALPQLAYVAFAMMEQGVQSLSVSELTQLLEECRVVMPEIVGYARMGVAEFVQRVEERSSILSISGHIYARGVFEPTYEFKHLTFQEYLAALAAVKGWHSRRARARTVRAALRKYLGRDTWREVVPLACVLAGPQSAGLIEPLITMLPETEYGPRDLRSDEALSRVEVVRSSLLQCLIDEVQIHPSLLHRSITALVESDVDVGQLVPLSQLLRTKFAHDVIRIVQEGYAIEGPHRPAYGSAVAYLRIGAAQGEQPRQRLARCKRAIQQGTSGEARDSALELMQYAFLAHRAGASAIVRVSPKFARSVSGDIIDRLRRDEEAGWQFAGLWALAWLLKRFEFESPQVSSRIMRELVDMWGRQDDRHYVRWITWVITNVSPLPSRCARRCPSAIDERLRATLQDTDPWMHFSKQAAFTVSYMQRSPWNTRELLGLISELFEDSRDERVLRLLRGLGAQGRARATEIRAGSQVHRQRVGRGRS